MDPPECSGHSHDHDHEDDLGLSLRPQIDLPNVYCLNEEVENAGRSVIKLHEERLSLTPSLTSPEDDPELLLFIPFTESVTLQSISIRSSASEETVSPKTVKIFTNRDDLDFDMVRELAPMMKLELLPPDHFPDGTIDYPCRPAGRFQNISSVAIFVEDNYDDDAEQPTEITFVGLKGKGTNMKRMAVETVYESRGMPTDHKVPGADFKGQNYL
mmetsp:Transcript_10285/g.15785  ORF Transcript_10285/g.15785 Transcript_10285/m.15785 type:complete len:214 (-) Transcript_10285:111-752(-)|eukprot:CAMPEP_0178920404 /NCGR_PEP_ID=MMETSP0786-20121207/14987_1 /TAXON_ID=186022 /ORGANISM="Thalassionema frauenfeldii, Strain CCMP 1798" /LENGTH=213 /DNA_ID=CAMNT_0020594469 /DNA_START=206 /DNA_END=847 /DNA_ORIENTATION=+